MKIIVYVNSGDVSPSGYYRILQYLRNRPDDIVVHSLMPTTIYVWWHKQSRLVHRLCSVLLYIIIYIRTLCFMILDGVGHDNRIIISKYIVPHYMFFPHTLLLKRLAKNNVLIWDFDDNIIESNSISRKEFNILSEYSKYIVVISSFLKGLIAKEYHNKVLLLPTTDGDVQNYDTYILSRNREQNFNKYFILMWLGTAGNLVYLYNVIRYLDNAALYIKRTFGKQLVLKVVCNKPLIADKRYIQIDNIPWSRQVAIDCMLHSHIGIMPLVDNRITRGKGGFKLIQYLSAGLPVIASSVGYNNYIVSDDCGVLLSKDSEQDWVNAILKFCKSWDDYMVYSRQARNRYENFFSYDHNLLVWNDLLK